MYAPTDSRRARCHRSSAWVDLCGFSASEVVGRTFKILQGPATDTAPLFGLEETVLEGRVHTATLINFKKSGIPFVNEVSIVAVPGSDDSFGRPTLLQAVLCDVTPQHASSQLGRFVSQLRAERSLARAVSACLLLEACAVLEDSAPHQILSVNEAWEDATGFPARECIGRSLSILDGPATDASTIAEALRDMWTGPERAGTQIHYKRSGLAFVSCVHIWTAPDEQGVPRALAVLRDVTQQHRDRGLGSLALAIRTRVPCRDYSAPTPWSWGAAARRLIEEQGCAASAWGLVMTPPLVVSEPAAPQARDLV